MDYLHTQWEELKRAAETRRKKIEEKTKQKPGEEIYSLLKLAVSEIQQYTEVTTENLFGWFLASVARPSEYLNCSRSQNVVWEQFRRKAEGFLSSQKEKEDKKEFVQQRYVYIPDGYYRRYGTVGERRMELAVGHKVIRGAETVFKVGKLRKVSPTKYFEIFSSENFKWLGQVSSHCLFPCNENGTIPKKYRLKIEGRLRGTVNERLIPTLFGEKKKERKEREKKEKKPARKGLAKMSQKEAMDYLFS